MDVLDNRGTYPSLANLSTVNLLKLSSGNPTYPLDMPLPPAHITPTSPNGTGSMLSSRMYTLLLGVGFPMDTGLPGMCVVRVLTIVTSVGPQPQYRVFPLFVHLSATLIDN